MNKTATLVKLGDIADVTQGQSPESKYYSEEAGTPFLQGNRTFGNLYPTFDTYTSKVTKFARNGDVLMSVRAPVGDLNIAPCDLCIGRGLSSLESKVCSNNFIYYSLKHSIANLQRQGAATTYSSVSSDIINDFDVIVPKNNDSWNSIAKVLFSLDTKIDINNKLNQQLENVAKLIYDYWFVQFDFPDANSNPYKSSGGRMVWNDELKREIPDEWEVGTLLDIADYVNGLACQKYRPTGSDTLRVIKIKEMHEGFSAETEFVSANIPQKVIIENGDVLFSWSASLEVLIWSKGKGALNQHIFKVTSDKYPKSFYFFQLINYLQHFKMMAENRKTTMGHITQEHLQQSRIVLPSKELTLKLDEMIAPILEKRINNELENQKLIELRDWLLPMLMNGQVKVKVKS